MLFPLPLILCLSSFSYSKLINGSFDVCSWGELNSASSSISRKSLYDCFTFQILGCLSIKTLNIRMRKYFLLIWYLSEQILRNVFTFLLLWKWWSIRKLLVLIVFPPSLSNGKFLVYRFQLQWYCELLIAHTWLYSAMERIIKMSNLAQILFLWKHPFHMNI